MVEIPPRAKKLCVGLQVYGPGKIWFDDVRAGYAEASGKGDLRRRNSTRRSRRRPPPAATPKSSPNRDGSFGKRDV